MKLSLYVVVFGVWCSRLGAADPPPPVFKSTAEPTPTAATSAAQPAATPAPPPSSPAKRSMADLEKLVAPIALYPDPLIATVLPASVYPLEIVQAARFVSDTNNIAKLDSQSWDDNVKAVARVPEAIKKLNDEISWTIELGEAFLEQDKDIMDAIQSMRAKAQKVGTLKSSPQQIVTVTNVIVEKTIEQQVVVVTNTVVQIQPSSSTTVYVPTYNPVAVYYPPPAYYANPYPLMTFGAGMAMGAIIANNCNWSGGGCYHSDVDIDVDRNVNRNVNREGGGRNGTGANANSARASSTGQKKWQPDQSRLSKSGGPTSSASARTSQARGYSSGGARPSTGSTGARPSAGNAGARPSAGTSGRPSGGNAGARPSTGASSANRAAPSTGGSRSSASSSRPSASPSASSRSSSGSAFGGVGGGSSARSSSSRGSASRGGGGSRGGGSRGGGGRR